VNFGIFWVCHSLQSIASHCNPWFWHIPNLLFLVSEPLDLDVFFAEALAHPLLADIRDKSLETTSPELVVQLGRTAWVGFATNGYHRISSNLKG